MRATLQTSEHLAPIATPACCCGAILSKKERLFNSMPKFTRAGEHSRMKTDGVVFRHLGGVKWNNLQVTVV